MARTTVRLIASIGTLIAIWLAAPRARQQGEPYRVTLDLVSIYATIKDADGRLVTDLTKDEFIVKDNGRKQTLNVFTNERQPISVVVLLDSSGSMTEQANLVRDGAIAFIKRMQPGDSARIGRFSNQIRLEPEAFSENRDELETILHAPPPEALGSPIWTALDRSVTALLKTGGRRVILLFTDGENRRVTGQAPTSLKDVIWRARVDDVMVYTVAFYGEGAGGSGSGGWTLKPKSPVFAPPRRDREAEQSLKQLADQTGGGYVEMKSLDDLSETFARVAEELHRQYWLGFKPQTLDNEMHEVDVTVKRPKLSVQARKSYFASKRREGP